MRAPLIALALLWPAAALGQLAPPGEATRLAPGGYRANVSLYALPDHRWYDGSGGATVTTIENGVPVRQSGNLSVIAERPRGQADGRGLARAFDGDFSHVHMAFQTLVKGRATLGEPARGYLYTPETAGIYGFYQNTSGWNAATAGNDGRTGATAMRLKVMNTGQGDMVAYNASGFVAGARPGATHFLANPAVSVINGGVSAGSDGVYLNPLEFVLDDRGHDVAGIGAVINLRRHNDAGALGVTWMGVRVQSAGTAPAGALFSGTGKARIGLDLAAGRFGAERAAITIRAGDRIYMAATPEPHHARPESETPGEAWLEYDAKAGWRWVAGGRPVLSATAEATTVPALALAGGCRILSGRGDPQGVVVAPPCSLYLRQGGGPGQTLYVKESGEGAGGWAAK